MKKVFYLMVAMFAILACSVATFAADTLTNVPGAALAVSLEPLAIGPDHDAQGNPIVPMPEALAGFVTGRTCCTKSVDAMLSAGPGDGDDDAGGDAHDGMAGGPSFRDIAGGRT